MCSNCGYAWHTLNADAPTENVETILVQIGEKYNALIGLNIRELTPQQLADYAKEKGKQGFAQLICLWHYREGRVDFIKDFCKAMGYHHAWQKHAIARFNAKSQAEKDAIIIRDTILK